MGIIEEVASPAALRAALDTAARNQGRPGPDGVSVAAFAANAHAELDRLRDELLTGAWRPRPALRIKISKPGGGHRDLAVGCVRDRVVQHALARALSDALDDVIHPSAWAWRRGRSARQCLGAVDAALAEGRHWVLRGDIASFFDEIPQEMLLATLREHTGDERLVELVGHMLRAGALVGGDILDPSLGTGQGSPLSPFLANLYLLPFDRAVEAAGFAMQRYGDDLCAATWTRDDAQRAKDTVTLALERLRLRMNPEKVALRHIGEGFTFLGFAFHPGGRRPGPKAARALAARMEEIARDRPKDGHEEVDQALRGWLTYYGSLAGVGLPDGVRARAEALEAEVIQSRQHGASAGALHGPPLQPTPAPERTVTTAPATPPIRDRWQDAALILHSARGTPDEGDVTRALGEELGVDGPTAHALADALRRFDGAAAAEVLARLGRYDDADHVKGLARPDDLAVPVATRTGGLPVEPVEQRDAPRFAPKPEDAERILSLFGGAEHTFLRDVLMGDKIERQRVNVAPTTEHLRAHLDGSFWMGIYPLRANNSTRWGAYRISVAAKHRKELRSASLPDAVIADGRRLRDALQALGISAVASVEPGRALVLWVLFAEAVTAARARALLTLAAQRAGGADASVTREIHPQQEVVKPDKPGSAMLLPLGRDARTGERAWLLDEGFAPLPDACAALREIAPVASDRVAGALGLRPKLPVASPVKPAVKSAPSPEPPKAGPDVVAVLTSPFQAHPRAQEVYKGCAVFRYMVDQAISGAGLPTGDRLLIADILGRTGDQGVAGADAVFRHLDDFRPGMGARFIARIYPHPTSCARIRQRLPELTARVGCDCRFRVPPGAYPTPVLHALGAAEVLGMGERVRDAAAKGGMARAAMAAMNEGRKELGAKAAALCARLSDLRRQARVLEKTIASVEAELDGVLDEAGDAPLETPSGTLRRVEESGVRRFVLEV